MSGLQGAVWSPKGKNEGESPAGPVPGPANACPSPVTGKPAAGVTGLGSPTEEACPGTELSILAWRPALLAGNAAAIRTVLDLASVASYAQGRMLRSFSGSLHQPASSHCQRNGVMSESPSLSATTQRTLSTHPSSSRGGGLGLRLRHSAF